MRKVSNKPHRESEEGETSQNDNRKKKRKAELSGTKHLAQPTSPHAVHGIFYHSLSTCSQCRHSACPALPCPAKPNLAHYLVRYKELKQILFFSHFHSLASMVVVHVKSSQSC